MNAILTYHSLDKSDSVISVRPSVFERQMDALVAAGVPIVPLSEIRKHSNSVAITFDDAFGNFADSALPVLERLSLPASVFVVSGYCGKRNNWPSQPSGVPDLPLMSWNTLRSLPLTIAVGAHSVTHPDLRAIDDKELCRELCESRLEIEHQTARRVTTLAYPYGAVNLRVAAAARREFSVACGTRLAFLGGADDPLLLPRLDTYYLKSAEWFSRPFALKARSYIGFRRLLREARAYTR